MKINRPTKYKIAVFPILIVETRLFAYVGLEVPDAENDY